VIRLEADRHGVQSVWRGGRSGRPVRVPEASLDLSEGAAQCGTGCIIQSRAATELGVQRGQRTLQGMIVAPIHASDVTPSDAGFVRVQPWLAGIRLTPYARHWTRMQ